MPVITLENKVMPYKTQKIPFNDPFLDKRSKLIPCQKEMIVKLSKEGWSQRKLAERFNVSRRLIQFIIDPKKLEECYQKRVERGGSKKYYIKEKHTEAIRNHRRYKHKSLKESIKFKEDTKKP